MSTNSTSATSALFPISLTLAGQTIDLSIPADVPLTELLSGMVQAFGRLEASSASQGYSVLTASGKRLNNSLSLPAQDVPAGSLLTLEPADSAASERRYDDLVEAVGDTIHATQTPWEPTDSLLFSSHASALLFVVAAFILLTQDAPIYVTALAGFIGTFLITLSATIVARHSPAPHAAIGLALSAPILAASAAHAFTPGDWYALPIMVAGLTMMATSPTVFSLPRAFRMAIVAPIVLGVLFFINGLLTGVFEVSAQSSAALIMSLSVIVVLLAPWFSLAQLSTSSDPMADPASVSIDTKTITNRVNDGRVAALSMKGAACVAALVFLQPVVASPAGVVLATLCGVALMLSTRSMYGKAEVLVGVIAGMLLATGAGIFAAVYFPSSMPFVVASLGLTAAIVLALNVISLRLRPHLTRAADAFSVIALLGIAPMTALIWGVI